MDSIQQYTEAAKNALFNARYEACLHGSRFVKPEHILLGLLRADPELFELVSGGAIQVDQIRETVEGYISRRAEQTSLKVTPLSRAAEMVLSLAAVEGRTLRHDYVGTEHILLGLLTSRHRLLGLITKSQPLTSLMLRDSGFDVGEITFRIRSGLVSSQSPRSTTTPVLGFNPLPGR